MSVASILVVDDQPQNLEVLKSILSKADYQVRLLREGRMVLPSVLNLSPDLILLDVNMPEMDGFEICKKLKENEQARDIPVIFVSAFHDIDNKMKGFESGGVDYITKPFKIEEVLARVDAHLKLRELQRDLQEKNVLLMKEIIERERAEDARQNLQRQLEQAHKMETIGIITNGVAHNFNNILSITHGFCDLACSRAMSRNDKEMTELLEQINESNERAIKLVNKMYAYSNPLQHEQPVLPDLQVEFDTVLDDLKKLIPENVAIRIDQIDESIELQLNNNSFSEIIVQLCLNGAAAMQGEGEISIGIKKTGQQNGTCASCLENYSGNYIDLYVTDMGCGIKPELLQKVFDPYFSSEGMAEHTGLGLSIVHGIVHATNGHILLDSSPGKGSTFHLLFPV